MLQRVPNMVVLDLRRFVRVPLLGGKRVLAEQVATLDTSCNLVIFSGSTLFPPRVAQNIEFDLTALADCFGAYTQD